MNASFNTVLGAGLTYIIILFFPFLIQPAPPPIMDFSISKPLFDGALVVFIINAVFQIIRLLRPKKDEVQLQLVAAIADLTAAIAGIAEGQKQVLSEMEILKKKVSKLKN